MKPPKPITALFLLIITTAALVRIDTPLSKSPQPERIVKYPEVENTLACDYYKMRRAEYSDKLIQINVSPLQIAAMDGDLEKVKLLISRGADPDVRADIPDYTPLQLASACGHTEIVAFLVSAGANVNTAINFPTDFWKAFEDRLEPPLRAAANAHIAGILLRNGADPNPISGGERPLAHFAGAFVGQASSTIPIDRNAIELMLKYGADINASSKNSPSILRIATDRYFETGSPEDLDNVRWLIRKGAVPDLAVAVMLKDAALVKKLLAADADPGKKPNDFTFAGDNPLLTAIFTADRLTAETLIAAGADTSFLSYLKMFWLMRNDISKQAESSWSENGRDAFPKPLLLKGLKPDFEDAILYNDTDLARKLLATPPKNKKNPCGKEEKKWLYIAALNGRTEITKLLIHRGCDSSDVTNIALRYAAASGNTTTAATLLGVGASPNANPAETSMEFNYLDKYFSIEKPGAKKTVLQFAAQNGDVPMIKLLLSHGADVNARDKVRSTALLYSTANTRISATRLLIDSGADVNAADTIKKTALHYAASTDTVIPIMKMLVSHGANIEARDNLGSTPLLYSAANQAVKAAAFLIDNGADINSTGAFNKTALHYAAATDTAIPIIEMLISHGANIEARNKSGATPLFIAAENRAVKAATLLIDKGADVNTTNSYGKTALHYAALNADPALVRILLAAGADPNARQNNGPSPLMLSACLEIGPEQELQRLEVDKLLIHAGAEARVAFSKGRTPLHCAAQFGRAAAARLYITSGEDPNVTNAYGKTPLHFAVLFASAPAVETLFKLGADPGVKDARGRTPLQYIDHPLQADAARSILIRNGNADLKSAILMSDTALIKKALDNGADTNKPLLIDGKPFSPLYIALTTGVGVRNVGLLISRGADFKQEEIEDKHGDDADNEPSIYPAVLRDCRLIPLLAGTKFREGKFKMMIGNGLTVSAADITLVCATLSSDTGLARKAIETSSRRTNTLALGLAIAQNDLEIATLVIDAGIDKKAYKEFFNDDTPLKLAEENGSTEIAALLRRHGYVK